MEVVQYLCYYLVAQGARQAPSIYPQRISGYPPVQHSITHRKPPLYIQLLPLKTKSVIKAYMKWDVFLVEICLVCWKTTVVVIDVSWLDILSFVSWRRGNIGNLHLHYSQDPGNIGHWNLHYSQDPGNAGGGRAAPGVVLCCLGLFLEHVSWNFRISWKYWKYVFSIFWDFYKKDARRNFTQNPPTDEPRSLIWDRFRPKTKTVSDPNFQVTAATAAATAASQQLSHLARALDHHAQGPNIPFGVNPSLRYNTM